MRHISDLIAEFSPNGVEYKSVSDLATYVRGVTYSKEQEVENGPVAVLRANNITLESNKLNFDSMKTVSSDVKVRENQKLKSGDILISAASGSKAHVGKVAYISENMEHTFGGFMAVLRAKEGILPRFLFHLLIGREFSQYLEKTLTSTTINNLNSTIMGNFKVPVPPMEIQSSIIEVLDNFMQLEAELEAELEARKKQYEYYRNQLLTFEQQGGVRWVPMGEFATLIRGNGMPKVDFSESGVPAIHYGQIYTHYRTYASETISFVPRDKAVKLAQVEPGDIVITNTSENIDDVGKAVAWLGGTTAVTGGHATVIKHRENPKYLAYYFQTWEFAAAKKKFAVGTKVIDVSAKNMAKIEIPLPSIDEQNRIVEILDSFEALVNDISIGLPAELKARRQQYEYYRDHLLTFKEIDAA